MNRLPDSKGSFGLISRKFSSVGSNKMKLALILIFLAGLLLPVSGSSNSTISLITIAIAYGIVTMSLDLSFGFAGMMSLGQASLFGMAAYVAGYISLHFTPQAWVTFPLGVLSAGLLGGLFGIILGRLQGVAFAIGTIALSSFFVFLAIQWRSLTGGPDGLVGLPFSQLWNLKLNHVSLYYLSLILTVVTYLGISWLTQTRFGIAIQAIRDNPERALSMGINVYLYRIYTMILSGLIAGIGGVIFIYLRGAIAPEQLSWDISGNIMIRLMIGGVRTLIGPFLSAVALTYLENELSSMLAHYWQYILGSLVLIVIMVMPDGVFLGIKRLATGIKIGRK